jgi:hypothetical protein
MEKSIAGLVNIIQSKTIEDTGNFFEWDGTKLEY